MIDMIQQKKRTRMGELISTMMLAHGPGRTDAKAQSLHS
jgi:hypothetical protein